MKKSLVILWVLLLTLTACQSNVTEEVYKGRVSDGPTRTYEDIYGSPEPTATEEASASEEEAQEATEEGGGTPTPATESQEDPSAVTMPTLPDLDFTGMTFKDDGYEIVEFKSLADGDTANFVVGGMRMACRFLGIDTPETSGSTGLQPWALKAKAYTQNALENAEVIILEKDLESDVVDKYGRLLAWVWVDGELLNYQLVEEGLAYVKYLYGDYKYNPQMIALESRVQKTKVKIWGEDDPDYNYDHTTVEATIAEARQLQAGQSVTVTGVVTNFIGPNAFISDGTASIYVYANRYNYGALDDIGTEVQLTGKIIDYNGLLEISSIENNEVTTLSTGHEVVPMAIEIPDISEEIEGELVSLTGLEVERLALTDSDDYDVIVKKDGHYTTLRVDKYLDDYPEADNFQPGQIMDVIGSVGQYQESYQIMINSLEAVTFK